MCRPAGPPADLPHWGGHRWESSRTITPDYAHKGELDRILTAVEDATDKADELGIGLEGALGELVR